MQQVVWRKASLRVETAPLPQRLGLLLALYLAQGIPFGVYSQAIPAILRSHDAPLSLISLSGLLALPFKGQVTDYAINRRDWGDVDRKPAA